MSEPRSAPRRGAVYDRGYRPVRGSPRRRGARRRSRCTGRRSAGRSACAGRGARRWRRSSCSASSRSRPIVNVGIGYVTREPGRRPLRDRDLPRLRRRVVGAAAVRRDRRARRRVPRPAPARAAADVRPPADRRGLRRWPRSGRSPRSCSPSRSCPRSCCSSATCWSATARSTTSAATSTCCGRCPLGGRPARRVLRRDRRRRSPR